MHYAEISSGIPSCARSNLDIRILMHCPVINVRRHSLNDLTIIVDTGVTENGRRRSLVLGHEQHNLATVVLAQTQRPPQLLLLHELAEAVA